MPAVDAQAGLQSMIGRTSGRFFLVYIEQGREGSSGHVEVDAVRAIEAGNRAIRESEPGTLRCRRVVSSNLRLGGLIDVPEAEQFGSPRANVSDLYHGSWA